MNNILFVLAVLPSIALGWFIYIKDKVGKEPTKLLIKLFIGGIASIVLTLAISFFIGLVFPAFTNDTYANELEMFIGVMFGVGLVEEFSKWVFLRAFTWDNKEFDHIFDAIVYAVFVSLGFATLENIIYIFQANELSTAILRAVVSVPGHVFDAILMGAFYGEAKKAQIFGKPFKCFIDTLLSIAIPMAAHGYFDYLLYLNSTQTMIIFFVYVAVLYLVAFITVSLVAKNKYNFVVIQCPNCGELTDGSFCVKCGRRVK